MNKITISLLFLFSATFAVPNAIAQSIDETDDDTRVEKYEDLTQSDIDPTNSESGMDMEGMESEEGTTEPDTRTEETMQESQSSDTSAGDDVRRTEAFNLVSSAYRGDFEEQGINSYAVLVKNYETGQLTAEDLINAAIDSGELSPSALEDESYVQAVDLQLESLSDGN